MAFKKIERSSVKHKQNVLERHFGKLI
jgi:hypothetical protein